MSGDSFRDFVAKAKQQDKDPAHPGPKSGIISGALESMVRKVSDVGSRLRTPGSDAGNTSLSVESARDEVSKFAADVKVF